MRLTNFEDLGRISQAKEEYLEYLHLRAAGLLIDDSAPDLPDWVFELEEADQEWIEGQWEDDSGECGEYDD